MDLNFIIATFIASAIAYSVSLLLGTLGELLTERAGHLNLGVEGMMLLGGSFGYVVAVRTQSLPLTLLAAMLGAGFGATLYAILTVTLRANQNVSGLALTTFGAGLANTLGSTVANKNTPENITAFFTYHPFELHNVTNPVLNFINIAFLSHDIFVYSSLLLAIIMTVFLFKTKEGLALRMVGENPGAADASGLMVTRIKYMYIVLGGMLCGLAGLYIPLVLQRTWHSDITAGKGWIVVALVIFVRWHPIKAIGGAFIFGALSIVGLSIQQFPQLSSMIFFNQYIMVMYPYILTVVVLVITYSRKKAWRGPSAIGSAYFREER
jgi:simple sugar transport system permease protein